jgi:hypothetical protein
MASANPPVDDDFDGLLGQISVLEAEARVHDGFQSAICGPVGFSDKRATQK